MQQAATVVGPRTGAPAGTRQLIHNANMIPSKNELPLGHNVALYGNNINHDDVRVHVNDAYGNDDQ